MTHPELCVCHGNCASACLKLGMYREALHHVEESVRHSTKSLHRSASRSTYARSFRRRGEALMGLQRWREAADAFAKAMDAGVASTDSARNVIEAQELKSLWKEAEGRIETAAGAIDGGDGGDGLLLTWRTDADPAHSQSITYHPHSASIHRIRAEEQLPHALLTPFQAENDPEIKETYNYMTVQADIRMPGRALRQIRDVRTIRAYRRAIEGAVAALESADTDARVLNLNCGPGVSAVHAIRAGARHVTATDRWLYLSLAAKETMLENEMDEARYDIVYKRPTELRLREDVPVSCNVLVIGATGIELESGVLLAAKHCFEEGLVMGDCAVLPGSLRILCRLAYRGEPVSEVHEAWYFDLKNAYDRSETKEIVFGELTGTRADGVEFWYELGGLGVDGDRDGNGESGDDGDGDRGIVSQDTRQVQRLAGELVVGDEVVVTASHNTVGLRFDVSSSNYLRLFDEFDRIDGGGDPPRTTGRMCATGATVKRRPSDRPLSSFPLEPYERAIQEGDVPRGGVVLVPRASTVPGLVDCLEEHGIRAVTTDLRRGTDPVQLQRGRNGVPIQGLDAVMLYDRKGRYEMVEEWRTALGFTKVVPSDVTWWCVGVEAVTRPIEGVKVRVFCSVFICCERLRQAQVSTVRLIGCGHSTASLVAPSHGRQRSPAIHPIRVKHSQHSDVRQRKSAFAHSPLIVFSC